MDAATRALFLLLSRSRERAAASEPEPAGGKAAPRQRQKRARTQPVTITLPSFGEASAPDALRTVHERAAAALAQLEDLAVAPPKWATTSTRRRHHQAAHALEAARVALRRALMLARQDQSAG